MAIDTVDRRSSAMDFGQITGTGMPIPSGNRTVSWRAHILNLYSGIAPISIPFIGWRARSLATSFWRKATSIPD